MNGEDTSSSSSEEEKDADAATPVNGLSLKPGWSALPSSTAPLRQDRKEEEDFEEEEEANCLPTIYFSHTVEPKKVRAMNKLEYLWVFCEFSLHLSTCLPFASGENKYRQKHHAEV